jgi:hypothetical protein
MKRPGDYIIEVIQQTDPDGYPDCQRTLGRVYITEEFVEKIGEKIVIESIGYKVLRLLK